MHQSPPRRRADRFAKTSLAALLACGLLAALPGAAHATFSGSSGKLAWATDGKLLVDDPYDAEAPRTITTVPKAESPLNYLAPTSAVSWSPDGTKLAFAKAVANDPFPEKTAIFVADLSEAAEGEPPRPVSIEQISFPYAGQVASCGTCEDGEVTHDHSPVWTDAGEVAFIREVNADDAATHVSENGATVRTIGVDGGSSRRVAHWNPKADGLMMSIVWPAKATEPVAIAATAAGYQLKKVASRQVLAQEFGIDDVDASPEGDRLVYQSIGVGGKRVKVIRWNSGEVLDSYQPQITDVGVRFAPDGTRLIVGGCATERGGRQRCGWKTRLIADQDADVRPDEQIEQPYLDGNASWGYGPTTGRGGRSTIDVQSQDLPVIFVPGYLGSEIYCGSERVWMPEDGPPIHLEKIALGPDGKSEQACQYAAPSGKEVKKFLRTDVYEHGSDWLREIKAGSDDPEGWYTLGWDWRKAPSESLTRVDDQIARLLKRDLPERQGAKRVAFATHSYGSLLVRDFVDTEARAKKVARVVTVGAPWWGAPKPVLPIAFGIETPEFSALDLFIRNTNLRTFMRNSAGAYHLAPSDNYGPFLRLDSQLQNQAGVSSFLGSTGGNEALHAQARSTHQRIDGFKDWNDKIDWRNLTGIGLPTVQGFNVVPLGDGNATVGLVFGQGDGTVPVRSSVQGEEGTQSPLGDPIHTQYRCGVPHMRQTADHFTQRAYADFLVDGAVPRKMPHTQCAISGLKVTVFRDIPLGTPDPRRSARSSSAPKSLAEAEWAHEADVIKLGGRTTIVTADGVGDGVTFEAQGDRIELQTLTAAGETGLRHYGPLTGAVVIGGSAGDPVVTVNGQRLAGTDGPAPVPTQGETPSGGAPLPAVDVIRAGFKVGKTLRVDAKGRIKLKVTARRAASGTLAITDKRGKSLAKAAKVTFPKARTQTATVTLSKAARSKLRKGKMTVTLTLKLSAKDAPLSTARAKLTIRR